MSSRPASRVYFPELDGLRFIAFLFVFVHHAFPERVFSADGGGALELARVFCLSGALGVDLFFCLSAFLITKLLMTERERAGRVALLRFYARRALRIWPLYLSFIALCEYWPGESALGLGGHTLPYLLFLGNWSCGVSGHPASPAGLLWSVSIEEQFYLLWPPVVARLSRAHLLAALVLMLAVSLAARVAYACLSWDHPMTWCSTLSRLDPLAAGIAVALWQGHDSIRWGAATRVAVFLSGVTAWMTGVATWPMNAEPTLGGAVVSYPVFAIGATLMLLASIAPQDSPSLPLLRSKMLVALGRISYGLYVFHVLALILAQLHVPSWVGFYDRFVIVGVGLAVTTLLATLSFLVIERPFLRLKERLAVVPSRPGG